MKAEAASCRRRRPEKKKKPRPPLATFSLPPFPLPPSKKTQIGKSSIDAKDLYIYITRNLSTSAVREKSVSSKNKGKKPRRGIKMSETQHNSASRFFFFLLILFFAIIVHRRRAKRAKSFAPRDTEEKRGIFLRDPGRVRRRRMGGEGASGGD